MPVTETIRGAIYIEPEEKMKDKPQVFATQQDELGFWETRAQTSRGDSKKFCQKMVSDIKAEMARRDLITKGLTILQAS